jgi:predicted RNA-binding protein with PIN domain
MAEQWLIDGYNLLHSLESLPSKKTSLSREKLFALVAEFASFKKIHTLLILDGTGDDGQLLAYHTAYFEVVFSQKVSADAYIEKYVYEQRDKKRLVVVTNDRAIMNIACGSGAGVLSTAQFFELFQECKKEGSEYLRKEKSREYGFHRPFEDKLKDIKTRKEAKDD